MVNPSIQIILSTASFSRTDSLTFNWFLAPALFQSSRGRRCWNLKIQRSHAFQNWNFNFKEQKSASASLAANFFRQCCWMFRRKSLGKWWKEAPGWAELPMFSTFTDSTCQLQARWLPVPTQQKWSKCELFEHLGGFRVDFSATKCWEWCFFRNLTQSDAFWLCLVHQRLDLHQWIHKERLWQKQPPGPLALNPCGMKIGCFTSCRTPEVDSAILGTPIFINPWVKSILFAEWILAKPHIVWFWKAMTWPTPTFCEPVVLFPKVLLSIWFDFHGSKLTGPHQEFPRMAIRREATVLLPTTKDLQVERNELDVDVAGNTTSKRMKSINIKFKREAVLLEIVDTFVDQKSIVYYVRNIMEQRAMATALGLKTPFAKATRFGPKNPAVRPCHGCSTWRNSWMSTHCTSSTGASWAAKSHRPKTRTNLGFCRLATKLLDPDIPFA